MSKVIFSGQSSGTFNSANNCEYIELTYTRTTPLEVPVGQYVGIGDLIPESEILTIDFQSQKVGEKKIMSQFLLLILGSIDGLRGDHMAFVNGTTQPAVADQAPVIAYDTVTFRVKLFWDGGRIFESGDTLVFTLSCSAGTLTARNIQGANAVPNARPVEFSQKTVQAGNEEEVPQSVHTIFVPNDDDYFGQLQLKGTTQVRYDRNDLITQLADSWVSNVTPINVSNVLGMDLRPYTDRQIQAAAANDLVYYYIVMPV